MNIIGMISARIIDVTPGIMRHDDCIDLFCGKFTRLKTIYVSCKGCNIAFRSGETTSECRMCTGIAIVRGYLTVHILECGLTGV